MDRQEMALEMIHWLKEQGVVFVEQPMPKESVDDIAWLTANSPLPVIADEAIQTVADFKKDTGSLQRNKYQAHEMRRHACSLYYDKHGKGIDMKVMIGCMTETSCAVTAAAQLSPLADWADLDGNLLINNDMFEGIKIIDGKIILPELPGIGITKM